MPTTPAYPVVFTDLTTTDGTTYRGGYCTVADVTLLFVNWDNFSKIQSNTKFIETMIADVSHDLDRALEPMYVVPITGTNSIQHMNFMNKHMAAAAIMDILDAGGGDDGKARKALVHHETASQRLDDIAQGTTQFFDAVIRVNGEKPAFPIGSAAEWNPDSDWNPVPGDPLATGPNFGVKDNPLTHGLPWLI